MNEIVFTVKFITGTTMNDEDRAVKFLEAELRKRLIAAGLTTDDFMGGMFMVNIVDTSVEKLI